MEKNQSIFDMAQGAVTEIINTNVAEILLNIQDPNTDKKARELNIKVKFAPADNRRQQIALQFEVNRKLRPINPIAISIIAGADENGELAAMELMEDIPGQQKIDGAEVPQPTVVNFSQLAREK